MSLYDGRLEWPISRLMSVIEINKHGYSKQYILLQIKGDYYHTCSLSFIQSFLYSVAEILKCSLCLQAVYCSLNRGVDSAIVWWPWVAHADRKELGPWIAQQWLPNLFFFSFFFPLGVFLLSSSTKNGDRLSKT